MIDKKASLNILEMRKGSKKDQEGHALKLIE